MLRPSPRASLRTLALAALAGLAAMTGCTPMATFPPDGQSNALTPWIAPCPEVMAKSLRHVHTSTAPLSPLVFNLPDGANDTTWTDVEGRLGTASRMRPDDTQVFTIERLRIRGSKAWADVSWWRDGVGTLYTVSLEREPLSAYRPVYLQRWIVPVEPPITKDPRQRVASTPRAVAPAPAQPIEPAPADEPAEGLSPDVVEVSPEDPTFDGPDVLDLDDASPEEPASGASTQPPSSNDWKEVPGG